MAESGISPVLREARRGAPSPRYIQRMGKTTGFLRGPLLLALLLCLPGMSACVAAGSKDRLFDIPAQPAASALNEFAKQADITLIFSYDLVSGESTRPLQGRFTVDAGLTRLLTGTPLGYRRTADGPYLICPRKSCEPGMPGDTAPAERRTE